MNKNVTYGAPLVLLIAAGAYYGSSHFFQNKDTDMMVYEETAPENIHTPESHQGAQNDAAAQERAFLEHMIPHHQEAITTAKEVLARGATTPEMKTLAEGIITAQEKEVTDMKAWYESWYGTPYQDSADYTPMMRDLSSLSGKELDQAFLNDMIAHHMEALRMAQAVAPSTTRSETRTLAQSIAETQSNEVVTMRVLLKQL